MDSETVYLSYEQKSNEKEQRLKELLLLFTVVFI